MQAPPIISAAPTGGAPTAGTTQSSDMGSGEQFSTHLAAAGEKTLKGSAHGGAEAPEVVHQGEQDNVDSTTDTRDEFSPFSTEITAPIEQTAIPADTIATDELTRYATAESIISLLTGQNQQAEPQNINTSGSGNQEQNSGIQNLQSSIQIPAAAEQQGNKEQPAAILNALLSKSLSATPQTKQENPMVPAQNVTAPSQPSGESIVATAATPATVATAATPAATNTGQPELAIENWRAQFSYQRSADPQEINNQKISAEQLQYREKGLAKEPVFTYATTTPEFTEVTTAHQGRSSSGTDITANQRQDANSQFIHSNLPGFSAKTDAEGNNTGQQQTDNGHPNLTGDNLTQAEQTITAKAGSDTPLIFSLDQERPPGLAQQSQTTSASQTLQLPSGTEVPHERIVDQVIDRFTMNRTLKSGAIALKLHPAELGELRMEIKVEQDNIKAHITTQNPQVQEILDSHLPKLREALEQQGFHLDQMKVTVGADDSNSQLFQEHFNRQQAKPSPHSNKDQVTFSLDAARAVTEEERATEATEQQQNLNVLV